jgi:hypothetical protein
MNLGTTAKFCIPVEIRSVDCDESAACDCIFLRSLLLLIFNLIFCFSLCRVVRFSPPTSSFRFDLVVGTCR